LGGMIEIGGKEKKLTFFTVNRLKIN
jgi:hypothetical protein